MVVEFYDYYYDGDDRVHGGKLLFQWEFANHWPTVGEQFWDDINKRYKVIRVEHVNQHFIQVFGQVVN